MYLGRDSVARRLVIVDAFLYAPPGDLDLDPTPTLAVARTLTDPPNPLDSSPTPVRLATYS